VGRFVDALALVCLVGGVLWFAPLALAGETVLGGKSLGSGARGVVSGRAGGVVLSRAFEVGLLGLINSVRAGHGLRPLRLNATLTKVAEGHTVEMGEAGYFAHASLDHTAFWQRIRRSYSDRGFVSWSVGENLLWSSQALHPPGALALWMGSPEHRANLLDPAWRDVGLAALRFSAAPGVYGGQTVTIITTDFGARHS